MSPSIIVTAGQTFNDIDAFACAIAYAQLLRLEGEQVVAVFAGPLNHTVTELAKTQNNDYRTDYVPQPNDAFVYVDISDAKYFAFYTEGVTKVREIFDHHYGCEEYWRVQLGDRAHVERVGAAATLIWEEYVKRGRQKEISPEIANLLLLAIFQNTLNFNSSETNERDRAAFADLKNKISLPENWQQIYLSEMSAGLAANFGEAIINDTKIFAGYRLVFSQFEIMESPTDFLNLYKPQIDEFFSKFSKMICLVNIADINSKKSLLYANDKDWLNLKLKPLFAAAQSEKNASFFITQIIQRKQVIKLIQEHEPNFL